MNKFKNELINSKDLLEKLKQLEPFLTQNTIDFLKSSINLETSILTNESINIALGELKTFREIAIYNIINRTQNFINNLTGIDIKKIHPLIGREFLELNYYVNDKDYFTIFNANLGDTKTLSNAKNEPFIHIFETNQTSAIEKMKSELKKISIPTESDDRLIGEDTFGNPIFVPVFGGPNSRKTIEAQQKIHHLKKSIETLEKFGIEEDEITKLVSDGLLSDWGIELKDNVKTLNWIKISKSTKI